MATDETLLVFRKETWSGIFECASLYSYRDSTEIYSSASQCFILGFV